MRSRRFPRPVRVLSVILILNLVWLPGVDSALARSPQSVGEAGGSSLTVRLFPTILSWFFGTTPRRPQRKTQADRIAEVAGIRGVSPQKRVAYQNEEIPFTAIAVDRTGGTVQGVPLMWSSDASKLEIDASGMAVAKEPGLVWVTVRAGFAEARVPVLIRPGARPAQSHAEFDLDQSRLNADGTTSSSTTGSIGIPPEPAPKALNSEGTTTASANGITDVVSDHAPKALESIAGGQARSATPPDNRAQRIAPRKGASRTQPNFRRRGGR